MQSSDFDGSSGYYRSAGFRCPRCNLEGGMQWIGGPGQSSHQLGDEYYITLALCQNHQCRRSSIWVGRLPDTPDDPASAIDPVMIWPQIEVGPPPRDLWPQAIIEDYEEARRAARVTPRGSAALSRLVVQKLLKELGQPGKHLYTEIENLIEERKLLPRVLKALEVVRIVGNESVHPGELDMRDDVELATRMLYLIDIIVADAIERDHHVNEIFGMMPEGKARDPETPQSDE